MRRLVGGGFVYERKNVNEGKLLREGSLPLFFASGRTLMRFRDHLC